MPSEPKGGPDVLRAALEEIARERAPGRLNNAIGRRFQRIAREALAASPPAEPMYEWRACADDVPGDEVPEDSLEAQSEAEARCLLAELDAEPPYAHRWIERRTAPGPWQRVPDEEGRRDG